ncbi:hypothetical protein MNBD_BACTEROID01-453 [hydrothermal vent metagenome]|uniref:DUF3109 family protein n=1 Tax=hydrothermal vent metagenome TaxID=652676 RepID=A0A3B0TMK8_9ZZZZ
MLEIGRTIISLDVIEEQFLCDLIKCKGACCVEGDSGAPLSKKEAVILEGSYPEVAPLLPEANKKAIEEWGVSYVDKDGDTVTTLVNNRECAFAYRDKKGILKCSIEKAFLDGKINFRKPLSCHLFPIRITEYKRFDAVNYEKLEICSHARACGSSNKLPLFKFLKEPLICKYGEEWYGELEIAAGFLDKD